MGAALCGSSEPRGLREVVKRPPRPLDALMGHALGLVISQPTFTPQYYILHISSEIVVDCRTDLCMHEFKLFSSVRTSHNASLHLTLGLTTDKPQVTRSSDDWRHRCCLFPCRTCDRTTWASSTVYSTCPSLPVAFVCSLPFFRSVLPLPWKRYKTPNSVLFHSLTSAGPHSGSLASSRSNVQRSPRARLRSAM